MKERHVLPDGLGIVWNDGDTKIVWSFKSGHVEIPENAAVERIQAKESIPVKGASGTLNVEAFQVYRIRSGT